MRLEESEPLRDLERERAPEGLAFFNHQRLFRRRRCAAEEGEEKKNSPDPKPLSLSFLLPHKKTQVAAAVDRGDLVPDSLVTDLVKARLLEGGNDSSPSSPSRTFILDGFPRTASQASTLLSSIARVPLALNLTLREQVLVDKCLGRRVCGKCGKGYNVADIMLPACESTGEPAVVMPPMPPPRGCEALMEVRSDDNPATVRHRLGVYKREARPLEAVFREAGVLVDFPVTGGVRETLPRLMEVFARAGAGGSDGARGGSANNSNSNSGSSSGDEGQRAA